jgi:hypothetical protein
MPTFRHLPTTSQLDVTANFEQLEAKPFWMPLVLEHGWENFGAPNEAAAYAINILREVRLKGVIKKGETEKSAFLLPAGARPGERAIYAIMAPKETVAELHILPDGEAAIITASNEFVAMSGVTFLAEN